MTLQEIYILVNAAFLFVAFIIVIILLRAGASFNFYYGIPQKQDPLRWRILRLLLLFIFLSLSAAVFNIVVPFFF